MNLLKTVSILLLAFVLGSCQQEKRRGDFNLLPIPQEFQVSNSSAISPSDLDDLDLANSTLEQPINKENELLDLTVNDAMKGRPESYSLSISKQKIEISGKDKAGVFYGLKTLEQLVIDAKEQGVNLPVCEIFDEPALAYRAIQLDIKHHLEKREYYYSLIDWLASYKVNAIIAEVEDKIKYVRQPLVGSKDALSIEEWQKLSDYAKDRNIEISPLVQGLGHASFVLKHDTYSSLRDNPDSDWAFNPLDPNTYDVQFDLYLDAIDATPHGKYLHVGGDEVHTTGRNSGKSALELQLIWLNKVSQFAEKHNRIPIFWDDMPLKHAGVYSAMFNTSLTKQQVDSIWQENEHKLVEFLDLFPKNCIYMRWNYNSPQAIGNAKAMEWFRNHDLPVMGATAGQTRWVLMPQNESNIENIRSFAVSSIEADLNGLLLTLWDDDSPHFELYKRGILAFAEYTWSGEKRNINQIKSAHRHREFSSELSKTDYSFIDKLEKPVGFWKNALLKGNKRNYLAKSENPLDLVIDLPDPDQKGAWTAKHEQRLAEAANNIEVCDSISEILSLIQSKQIRNPYRIQVYEQVNELVLFTLNTLLLLEKYDNAETEEIQENVQTELQDLAANFEKLRTQLEKIYGKSRVLSKPNSYILDQDHHVHLANQSVNFDWQFLAEMSFFEKLNKEIL